MGDEKPPEQPPPLPDVVELDQSALERWLKLPEQNPVLVPFSRQDLDRLMLGLRQVVLSQIALGDTVQALTVNDMERAEQFFRNYAETSRFAYSNFNMFISHIMRAAQAEEVAHGDGT